ncbi:hypothetical protein E2542_SST16734 [Spatholobus suberectus]|nr:hypothetical protein E2542_SST16734 [Spatholobus suberectus]
MKKKSEGKGNPTKQGLDKQPTQHHNLNRGDHITGNTCTSGGIGMNDCSGTDGSFRNYGTGLQTFIGTIVTSGSCVEKIIRVFSPGGGGPQVFRDTSINGVLVKSPNNLSGTTSSSRPETTSNVRKPYCSGTRRAFTNHGKGSQTFNGVNISSGAK